MRGAVLLAVAVGMVGGISAATASAALPTQYLGKLYTEGLGRAVDFPSWTSETAYLTTNGCTLATLRTVAKDVYTSAEYNGLGYDDQTKVLTLYRGILSRDPDPGGLAHYTGSLAGGASMSAVIDSMTSSAEFSSLMSSICAANPDYGWGTFAAVALTSSGAGYTGTQAGLQALLDSTPSGGTVALAQKSLISLSSSLNVPAGVTLTTTGAPGPTRYGVMGRLARGFNGTHAPTVVLQSGAKLKSVWVDGQRTVSGYYDTYNPNVALMGGTATEISSSRVDNTAGWTSIATAGHESQIGDLGYHPCTSAVVSANLVTSYASTHASDYSDGISNGCEHATITGNTVADASDVGIIIFEADGVAQQSQVSGNTVINLGQSAYAAYAADPLRTTETTGTPSFAGSSVHDNVVFSSPTTHYHAALAVGTRVWFAASSNDGTGASFTNNSVPSGGRARANDGIVVSGMLNATVTGNTIDTTGNLLAVDTCPLAAIGASVLSGHASGTIQGPYTDSSFSGCIFGS